MISHFISLDTSVGVLSHPNEFERGHATSTSLLVKKEGWDSFVD